MNESLSIFFGFLRNLLLILPTPILTLFSLTFAFFIFFALYRWIVKGEPD